MTITLQKVIYEKKYWLKEKAEAFIYKHKKQDCFELQFKNLYWWVRKVKPISIETIN